ERRGGLQVWNGLDPAQLDQQLKVVAVIYDDGTHIGSAPDPAYKGTDVIAEIFEARKGRADEWAKWKDFISHLPQDDNLALAQFFKAAEQLHIDTTSYSQYDSGVSEARAAIQASVKRMRDALAAHTQCSIATIADANGDTSSSNPAYRCGTRCRRGAMRLRVMLVAA